MARLEFWYEFASTYSYPAAMRIEGLAKNASVEVVWRPFLLGPIFKSQGWTTSPFNLYPAKGAYMWRDMERICAGLELPFKRPNSFPQNGLLAARLAVYGLSKGWGAAFSKAVFRSEFGNGYSIDDANLLARLVAQSGGDAEDALRGAVTDANKSALSEATRIAAERGIFGSPSFLTESGELFWGNDRLEQALSWA